MTPIAAACFLSRHVPLIACREDAGQCFTDIKNAVDTIERMINRPRSKRFCGVCPTMRADKGQEVQCGESLYAKHDDVLVTCWRCKQSYDADRLIQDAVDNVRGLLYSSSEILAIMAQIGEPVPARSWRYWRANGKIPERNEWGAEPGYWLEDVRKLRNRTADEDAA
jgi:hypothetical protein